VVENTVQGDVLASLTPIPRLQIGLRLPVAFSNGHGIDENAQPDKVFRGRLCPTPSSRRSSESSVS
jgi:hypothetical protein